MVTRFLLLIALWVAASAPARADDVSRAGRGVARIIVGVELADGRVGVSMGSGFAVSAKRIVTNYHVVEIYDRFADEAYEAVLVVVPSQGSKPFAARLVHANEAKDLALLELEEGSLPALRIFSGAAASGETIAALGYPGNVDLASARSARDYVTPTPLTRSGGEISSNRVVEGNDAYLHDAQIARGNSGGPLVDRCGRVIGVNAITTAGGEGDATFAFAISNRELLTFLSGAGMSPATEGGACVTTEERARQRLQRANAVMEKAKGECERRNARAQKQTDLEGRVAEARAQKESENRLFISLALLMFGGLALGGAAMLLSQRRPRQATAAAVAGAVLLAGSALLFAYRHGEPPLIDLAQEEDCQAAASQAKAAVDSGNIIEAAREAVQEGEATPEPRPRTESNTTGM